MPYASKSISWYSIASIWKATDIAADYIIAPHAINYLFKNIARYDGPDNGTQFYY